LERIYVDGAWTPSTGTASIPVENPATEKVITQVPDGTPEDVDLAVAAARRAFPAWAATDADTRAALLRSLADGLAARRPEVAATITAEMGCPAKVADSVQVGLPITVLRSYADLLGQEEPAQHIGHSLVLREPVGVVAAITPWNYPLHQAVAKVAAALAAGCAVVLKPSEVAPLSAYSLLEIAHDAGLPPGVLNLVSGSGPVVGEALARHPGVDMVSFTGSTRAGRRVAALAADTVKRVALELGGKSANLLLDDADLTAAVKVGVANCMLNAGQTCTAWTRMLVPARRYDEAVELAAAAAGKYTLGDPTDPATRMGPLASGAQRERVLGYLRTAVAEGARVAAGGPDAEVPGRGHFVAPTVLADVAPDATVAREEIFGPVLSIIRYAGEDEAVEIANNTQYGLAGAVWSADVDRAVAVARRLRTGQVDINGAAFNPLAPFGGYKQSGVGRELGAYGLDEFREVKSVQLPKGNR
jgi:aldehyde dehydrogenase (NAD+)